jgi:hypothetical protein
MTVDKPDDRIRCGLDGLDKLGINGDDLPVEAMKHNHGTRSAGSPGFIYLTVSGLMSSSST